MMATLLALGRWYVLICCVVLLLVCWPAALLVWVLSMSRGRDDRGDR